MSTTPHDDLVRAILSHPEHAAGELRYLLPPEVGARIDWTTLELVPGNFVEEALQGSYTDLLFRVRLGGQAAFLYVLFEHQSTPDALMPFRHLEYAVRFWKTWLADHPDATRLPVVIPMLLCHAPRGWTVATRFEELLDVDDETRALILDFVPRFRTLVDDLTVEPDDSLRARAMSAVGRLMLWCLKTARSTEDLLDGLARWAAVFREARRSANGATALGFIWTYILCVHDAPQESVLPRLNAVLDEEQKKEMSLADHLREKGRKEGEKKGIEKGKREVVQRQLQHRFGPLPPEALERLQHAAPSELDQWVDRVLTAATLTDVLDAP
jgi:predicted transposase/invertase (TIGR01784 family)